MCHPHFPPQLIYCLSKTAKWAECFFLSVLVVFLKSILVFPMMFYSLGAVGVWELLWQEFLV